MAGFGVGLVFALRRRLAQPFYVGAMTALHVGLLGAQFTGFRELLPLGMERVYYRFWASEDEAVMRRPLGTDELVGMLGVDVSNWSPRRQAVTGSAVAGGLAGFIMTSSQGVLPNRSQQ